MIKKILAAALAATICVTCFVGCGGSSGNKGDSATLTIAVVSEKDEVNIINKLIDGYKKSEGNENKKIEVTKITTGLDNWLSKGIYAKTLTDMVQVYDFSSEYWTYKGVYRSISDLINRDDFNTDDYFASSMEIAKSGQNSDDYYWLPRDYNKVVVCYNKDIFEFAGVDAPSDDWTMEQFVSVCQKLKKKSAAIKEEFGIEDFYPAQMKTEWYAVYYPFIKTYGGDLFDLENNEAFKNFDKVTKALDTLLRYSDEGYTVSPDESETDAFGAGQAAMVFTSRPSVQSYVRTLEDVDLDFASVPRITDGEAGVPSYIGMGCTGYAITTSCSEEKLELAWDFLKYVVSEAGQEVIGATGSGVPVLKSLADSKTSAWRQAVNENANHDAFVKYPERDLPMNYLKGVKVAKHTTINEKLVSMMSTFYVETGDRKEAYKKLKSDLETLLKA